MKKISIISLLIVVFTFSGPVHSQSHVSGSPQTKEKNSQEKQLSSNDQIIPKYSDLDLKKASLNDLNYQLIKAKNLRNTGIVLSILGPAATLGGLAVIYNDILNSQGVLFLGGVITTLVGIPILITGSNRVKRINSAINTHDAAGLNIAPSFVYNNKTQNLYPGVTLGVKF